MRTIAYDVIGVNVFLLTLMRFLLKKVETVVHPILLPLILHDRAYRVYQASPNWIRSAGMNLCFKNLLAWNFLVGPSLNKNLLTLKIWNRSLFSKNLKMCALWQIRLIDIDSSLRDQFSSETIIYKAYGKNYLLHKRKDKYHYILLPTMWFFSSENKNLFKNLNNLNIC